MDDTPHDGRNDHDSPLPDGGRTTSLLLQYDVLSNLTPTQKLVYLVLSEHSPMSRREVTDYTGVASGGVSTALNQLEELGLASSQWVIDGAQKRRWVAVAPNKLSD